MFSPLFSHFFAGSGQGLVWEIRRNGEVVESSQPNKPEPAETKVAQASAIRRPAGKDNRSEVAAISKHFERAQTRRQPKTASTEPTQSDLDKALQRARNRRGI